MTPTHANKALARSGDGGTRRYRYYVTRPDQLDEGLAWRVSARDLEAIVRVRLEELLLDRRLICDLASRNGGDAAAIQQAINAADLAAATLRSGNVADQLPLVGALVQRVQLHEDRVVIEIATPALLELCGISAAAPNTADPIELACETVKVRRGHEVRLVIPGPVTASPPPVTRDAKLVALLAEATAARQVVLGSPDRAIARIAADAGRCRARLTKLFALAHLAPTIVTAILEGRQPTGLSAQSLLDAALPVDWAEQRTALGFG